MLENNPTHNFTIGIEDDLTNLSLKIDDHLKLMDLVNFNLWLWQ